VSGCSATGFSMAAVLTWAPPSSGPLSGCRPLYKAPFPPWTSIFRAYASCLPWILSWRRGLPVGWWRPSVAGVTLVSSLYRSCWGHAAFDKASIVWFSSSSPAQASDDEDASRLLAQSALWLKPASLAGRRGDPWGISRQMALPLAYPGSYPHDTRRCTNRWHTPRPRGTSPSLSQF
jgi:hypothetical protein